jgi:hypothetical protein
MMNLFNDNVLLCEFKHLSIIITHYSMSEVSEAISSSSTPIPQEGARNITSRFQVNWWKLLLRGLAIWVFFNLLTKRKTSHILKESTTGLNIPTQFKNGFSQNDFLDLYFYVSDVRWFDFQRPSDEKFPSFELRQFVYWDWTQYDTKHFQFSIPEHVQKNGSLYGHVFLTRNGALPQDYSIRPQDVVYRVEMLTKYIPLQSTKKTKHLLSQINDKQSISEELTKKPEPVISSYWNPNITINWIIDTANYSRKTLPSFISERKIRGID